ncbi:hypothetical protein P154DRAFT_522168 [Amniculicola lignicola CBS 123094]|uniref:DDE-1 domain-containing protein n=1 Tax=Amniculicola lignicola CBS 123094 TaxID=1392246 RepID=A0A6A5WIY2_9PLEO|nr:hypothetical protein P154DRAFT_522168 [Amniculicola lignicola CBS 123094]
MDSHTSHLTHEFVTYTYNNRILLYTFPPYTTHFMQPLDMGYFQPLKTHHGQELDLNACTGAFKRIGIVPYKPEVVLKALHEKEEEDPHEKRYQIQAEYQERENKFMRSLTPFETDDEAFKPLSPHARAQALQHHYKQQDKKISASLCRGLDILNAKMDNETR